MSDNMGFPLRQRPATLRDIGFVMIYAKFCINQFNPNGTITSEILGTLSEIVALGVKTEGVLL